MEFKFSQYEAESRADKILAHGDDGEIARRVGKGSGIISQMFSPNDERESNFYKAAREISAVIDIDRSRGCQLLRLFVELCERHLPEIGAPCVQQETKKFNKELRDYYDADMCNEPLDKQIAELYDVEMQAQALRKAKEIELEKERIRAQNGL